MNPTSTDGSCGSTSDTNATCLNSKFGNCCSSKGFCGKTSLYCGEGCQSKFGKCNDLSVQTVSITGSCGSTSSSNVTCLGSEFGDCCSGMGYCGKNSTFCGADCQAGFGKCNNIEDSTSGDSSGSDASTTSTRDNVSEDGNCGSNSDIFSTCLGSDWGDCCSRNGFCGGNSSYCGTGCQSEYGDCQASTAPTGTVSLDGNCGPNSGVDAICKGSSWGDCCSHHGFCGGNATYCGAGCQSEYGSCDDLGASASPDVTAVSTSDGGLSTGAIAGIGVAAGVAGCALIGVIVWFVFFRRKRGDAKVAQEESQEKKVLPEEADSRPREAKTAHEMHPEVVSEMDGTGIDYPIELPARR